MAKRVRPAQVPEGAEWNVSGNEWELIPRTDGQKHGVARWWRTDGTLCCECTYDRDAASGPFRRFHENGETSREGAYSNNRLEGPNVFYRSSAKTTEHFPIASKRIWRAVMVYVGDARHGDASYFAKDGRPLDEDGKPLERSEPGPPPAPRYTLAEVEALQAVARDQLETACERISLSEAQTRLEARGLAVPSWWPSAAPDDVAWHAGPLTLGALRLDDGGFTGNGLVVDGPCTLELVQNGEQDFGPFLVVLGDLRVHNAAVSGANLDITGSLAVTGAFHGFYNHGSTRVGGTVTGDVLVDDYDFEGKRPRLKKKGIHPAFLDDDALASEAIYDQLILGGALRKSEP